MDMDKLKELFAKIPPRGPRGTPQCKEWERTTQKFEREARRQGIPPFDAYRLCRGILTKTEMYLIHHAKTRA